MPPAEPQFIALEQWQSQAQSHYELVDQLTVEVRERKQSGVRHPIEDFLWEYYSLRPNHLRRWHPGWNAHLEGASEYETFRGYRFENNAAFVSQEFVEHRRESLQWMLSLLEGVATREAKFGCFGLHEWAMVYRLEQSEV
ncbi:MAG: hypothetical protein RIS75_1216, partial [Actinomycetota bacterium]